MDAQAHALIDVLQQRIILEQCRLVADHILVESHCRTSLSFSWRQRMHLLRRLVYQREHHLERNAMLLQQLLTDGNTVMELVPLVTGTSRLITALPIIGPPAYILLFSVDYFLMQEQ